MMEWQWHQLEYMQIICTLFQTGNHASTSSLDILQTGCSTSSAKAVKECTTNGCKSITKCRHCQCRVTYFDFWDIFLKLLSFKLLLMYQHCSFAVAKFLSPLSCQLRVVLHVE